MTEPTAIKTQDDKDLSETLKQLQFANETLQMFNQGVSHDLRHHSINLVLMADMLEKELEQTEAKQLGKTAEIMKHLRRSAAENQNTIQAFLEIIRIQQSATDIQPELITNDAIEKILLGIRKESDQAQIDFIIRGEPSMFPMHLIKAILQHLIGNSIKYCKDTVKPIIGLDIKGTDEWINIRVIDNGIGIDLEKYREKLFGLFTQLKSEDDGNGLGLFLVNKIVNLHKGKIDVQSAPEEGAEFKIRIKNYI